jgi:hypothetical protein
LTAGEQPPLDVGDGAGGADLASPGQSAEEAGERFGDLDVVLAEADGQVRDGANRAKYGDLRELAVAESIVGWTVLDGLAMAADRLAAAAVGSIPCMRLTALDDLRTPRGERVASRWSTRLIASGSRSADVG